jgi:eukaryotic-like serine/threonine-protein kinase
MRVRRHVPGGARREPGPEPPAAVGGETRGAPRRWLRDGLIVAATFGIGYIIASAWLSPVSLFSSDHAVPRILDLPVAEAEAKLAELGFRGRAIAGRAHPTIPAGRVAWQDPPPGVVLGENTVVSYVPSMGPAPIPVPDVIGFSRPHAERVLDAAGLRAGVVDTVAADPEPGVVIATRPAAGTAREPGAAVDLVVSGRARPGPPAIPALRVAPLGSESPRP